MNFNSEDFGLQLDAWLAEDLGAGDCSTLASIGPDVQAHSRLLLKEDGVVAGLELASVLLHRVDPSLNIVKHTEDGQYRLAGTLLAEVRGSARSLLSTERLMLNLLQHCSGIATATYRAVEIVKSVGSPTRILDTRKTLPGLRALEKWAVRMGGGFNHRMGLYDMFMLKDNHIDTAGGIDSAVEAVNDYRANFGTDLALEVETRNLDEVKQALACDGVQRIMLDNFSPERIKEALALIQGKVETEASGGIHLGNLKPYAETGVDFISLGALTHSVRALDISFKTQII
ncbi:MAG: carboxylating nicotinate-nucleotide diphosphorylase [Bacteroidota bacterium]